MSLIHTIRGFVVPHESNGFRPRALEADFFFIAVIVVIALKLVSVASFSQYLGATIFDQISQSDLYTLTNQARTANNFPVLTVNSQLETAAQLKLNDMIVHGYFAHVSPQGVSPWTWFEKANYNYQAAGENLAMDFNSSQQVMQGWMNSPLHRKNILLPDFTQIGIAIGSGTINGQQGMIVVQMFGKPMTVTRLAVATPKPIAAVTPKPSPRPSPVKTATPTRTPSPVLSPVPSPVNVAFRSIASQPIRPALPSVSPLPVVQGAETTREAASYFSVQSLDMLLTLIALASIVLCILNIFVARHVQFKDLIIRSMVLVGICLILVLWKDPQLIGNHLILPLP